MTKLGAAVEQLPHAMQEVIFRRIFLGEPFDAIARTLDRSPGATRVLLARAVRRLRVLCEDSLLDQY